MALEHFAREVGAGTRKRVLLVLDGAGWHTAKNKLRVPEGIHLEFLPAHSPELMPSERLWPLSDEALANRYMEQIEQLEEALVDRCAALSERPEIIRSYIRYHWWPMPHNKRAYSNVLGIILRTSSLRRSKKFAQS